MLPHRRPRPPFDFSPRGAFRFSVRGALSLPCELRRQRAHRNIGSILYRTDSRPGDRWPRNSGRVGRDAVGGMRPGNRSSYLAPPRWLSAPVRHRSVPFCADGARMAGKDATTYIQSWPNLGLGFDRDIGAMDTA